MQFQSLLIRAEAAVPDLDDEQTLVPLNCEIGANQLICFLGQRFTTLNLYMQMLAALIQPKSGQIHYFSPLESVTGRQNFPTIAYLPDNASLLSVLNGIENVKLPALYHQLGNTGQIQVWAEMLLAEFEYEADHSLLPAYMTGLQKRHLLIARALILTPKLLVIENPFAGLDWEQTLMLGDYLARLVKEKNLTIVTSNANLAFVELYASQIIYANHYSFEFFPDWSSFAAYKQHHFIHC